MHILVHDVSGRQYCFPAEHLSILPGCHGQSGTVVCHGKQVMTQETTGELIAMLQTFGRTISLEDLKAKLGADRTAEHCQTINDRAQAEELDNPAEILLSFGEETVNAMALHRRRKLMLPDGPPVIFIRQTDAGPLPVISSETSDEVIQYLVANLRNIDGAKLETILKNYREERELAPFME